MAYSDLTPEVQEVAERVLTKNQLRVFALWCGQASPSRIALMLGTSEPVARRTLVRARQLIQIELEKEGIDESSAA